MSETDESLSRKAASGKMTLQQKIVFSPLPKRAVLAVFARAPQREKVKTRLARSVGSEAALRLYSAMLRDTLALSQRATQMARGEVVLFFTPPESCALSLATREYSRVAPRREIAEHTRRALRESIVLAREEAREYSLNELWSGAALPQSAGDLGKRMRACDALLRARGAHHVVIIGCDAPDLPPEIIRAAFESLKSCDLVFGPAHDGGFYLIGASRDISRTLFCGVRWSRKDVLSRVLANARREKLRVASLPKWRDVDDYHDLRALKKRLQRR